jgi:hypothetical protein
MAGSAREEAERLVATVLAMAGRSGLGGGGSGAWATGSAECCVCPVCRVIAGLRDPHPVTAERLATGAGDLATGMASLLRAVSAMAGNARPPAPPPAHRPPAPPANPDTTWSAATRTTDAQPADAQPADAQPADAQPADAVAADAQRADARPAEAQPAGARPADARPADAQPVPREHREGDVWAAATGDQRAAGSGTVDHDGTEA